MLTTSGILDQTLSLISDNSATMRAKLLTWLNMAMQALAVAHDWNCLEKSDTITSSGNAIALPEDFAKMVSASQSGAWFMDSNARLGGKDVYRFANALSSHPVGFYQDSSSIVFVPSVSGDIDLSYLCTVPTYTDSTSATVFPEQFGPLLVRTLLTTYYEYDADERNGLSLQLDAAMLRDLKAWDNKQKPVPFYEARGYGRQ